MNVKSKMIAVAPTTYETINPDLIAKTYLEFHNQDKSAWSWEIELRTSVEKF